MLLQDQAFLHSNALKVQLNLVLQQTIVLAHKHALTEYGGHALKMIQTVQQNALAVKHNPALTLLEAKIVLEHKLV